jgi:hypothetical protein
VNNAGITGFEGSLVAHDPEHDESLEVALSAVIVAAKPEGIHLALRKRMFVQQLPIRAKSQLFELGN